ncbi:MAG: hypothetical protein PF904_10840 [Kiritimatiellae bacterium]|jgi:hypothetical protein|nr:hypothetical protein [Kiritimatiellia bacterium]
MKKRIKHITLAIIILLVILILREQHYKNLVLKEIDSIRFCYDGTTPEKDIMLLKKSEKKIKKYTDKMYSIRKIDAICLQYDIECAYTDIELYNQELELDTEALEKLKLQIEELDNIGLHNRIRAHALHEKLRFSAEIMFISIKKLYRYIDRDK